MHSASGPRSSTPARPIPTTSARSRRRLAPDVLPQLRALVTPVPAPVFAALAPVPIETGIIAIARRPQVDARAVLDGPGAAPVVLLEAPAHLGNLGAVVRVAAAAGAAAVLTTGTHDPWHPAALRGSAGLAFRLAGGADRGGAAGRRAPALAIDPAGEPLRPGTIPDGALLAFGSERRGLSEALLAAADRRIAIPMRAGVSSLNLASAVAVILYLWRLARPLEWSLRSARHCQERSDEALQAPPGSPRALPPLR